METPASRLSPYLLFRGQAREALDHYVEVFGGEVSVMTYEQMGGGPTGTSTGVMHGQFTMPAGDTLMAADHPEPGEAQPPTGVTLTMWGSDEDLLRRQFEALAADGEVGMPFERQPWGDLYGDLTDRFGVSWAFNVGSAPQD